MIGVGIGRSIAFCLGICYDGGTPSGVLWIDSYRPPLRSDAPALSGGPRSGANTRSGPFIIPASGVDWLFALALDRATLSSEIHRLAHQIPLPGDAGSPIYKIACLDPPGIQAPARRS